MNLILFTVKPVYLECPGKQQNIQVLLQTCLSRVFWEATEYTGALTNLSI